MKRKEWMKKLWILAAIVCLTISCMPVAAFATESEAVTETETYVIPEDAIYLSDAEDVLELAENCISDIWSLDKTVVLSNDINMAGVEFASIPTFAGTFLGQGFTISGIRLTCEKTALGFFRYLQKTAVVEDLHLNITIQPAESGNTDIGGMVGINYGTIRNCTISGTVSGNERIGGIAGQNKVTGIIENCTVSGVVSGDHYIGGIVGENQGVIRQCTNLAEVNTQVDHNAVSFELPSGFSLENFTMKESTSDATNIGGIAGTSSGVIRGCENRANIGYEKMGYNVGGIAGSQIGYITECANYGDISGSDGVGGIVGQFKPNVALEFGPNPMDAMSAQMSGMMSSMGDLMNRMGGMMGSMSGMMGSISSAKNNIEDSMALLKNPENWNPDSMNAALNGMSSSFNEIYYNISGMGGNMSDQMNGMMGSMNGMMSSMNGMANTIDELGEGVNIQIIDVSKEDTAENTLTKVSDCANYGAVYGENYVGGITGLADVEDTSVLEEVEGKLSFSNTGEVTMRLVIRDCRNYATVVATKQYAGGIVGNMTIGAIFGGMNIGNMDSLNADYVGGIAGSSKTYITDSFSRSVLAGNQYVGGIAGFGTEVTGCYAITDIAASTKFAGGVLGYTDQLPNQESARVLDNHYYLAGKNLGGIDGISYDGATAPMTVQEFLVMENLDDMFRTVTIRFVAEGQADEVLNVDLGQSLAVAKIPQVETQENELYQWQLRKNVTSETLSMGEVEQVQYISKERLTNILFDQTYEAVFDAKNMVVYSENKAESGRPLALAVGAFDKGITLKLTDVTEQEASINGVVLQENWQVTMEDIGIEKLHYHIPQSMDAERIVLYVKDISDNWVQREFTVEGSYMVFAFTHGESGFALEVLPQEELPVTTIAIVAGAVVLLLIAAVISKKHKAKKKGTASEKK